MAGANHTSHTSDSRTHRTRQGVFIQIFGGFYGRQHCRMTCFPLDLFSGSSAVLYLQHVLNHLIDILTCSETLIRGQSMSVIGD